MRPRFLLFIWTIMTLLSCQAQGPGGEAGIIYLQSEELRAGILPEVGGRLVFLGDCQGKNLLKSDSLLWNEPPEERMPVDARAGWKAYNGHIIWPGPQSEWWTHQDLNPERRRRRSQWPPDPYLIYGSYKVLKHKDNNIILESPASLVSGIKLTKTYRLEGNKLHISVQMENTSDSVRSWDIWSNARFSPLTDYFVPGASVRKLAVQEKGWIDPLYADTMRTHFSFLREEPSQVKRSRTGKAYLQSDEGRIVVFPAGKMLIMDFPVVAEEDLHPDQAFIEIYQELRKNPEMGLLELEHHSAHMKLQPGERFKVQECWTILEYKGAASSEEQEAYYYSRGQGL